MSLSRLHLGILAMLVAALAAPGVVLACRCIWAGPFTTVALATELVVLADVKSYERHGMDVAVVEVLKGQEGPADDPGLGRRRRPCRPTSRPFRAAPAGSWRCSRARVERLHDLGLRRLAHGQGDQAVGRVTATERSASAESSRWRRCWPGFARRRDALASSQ
jgi:hypothetical protein